MDRLLIAERYHLCRPLHKDHEKLLVLVGIGLFQIDLLDVFMNSFEVLVVNHEVCGLRKQFCNSLEYFL
jgi:hypothetical protein